MKLHICLLLTILTFLESASADIYPKKRGSIIDEGFVINASDKTNIYSLLHQNNSNPNIPFFVVIVNTLHGYSINYYGKELLDYWGISNSTVSSENSNGYIMLLISVSDQKSDFIVNATLSNRFDLGILDHIVSEYIDPELRKGNFSAAALSGVTQIMNILNSSAGIYAEEELFEITGGDTDGDNCNQTTVSKYYCDGKVDYKRYIMDLLFYVLLLALIPFLIILYFLFPGSVKTRSSQIIWGSDTAIEDDDTCNSSDVAGTGKYDNCDQDHSSGDAGGDTE